MQTLLNILITITLAAIVCLPTWSEAPAAERMHPAVVRIVVPERGGASLGSGTLVAVNQRYGLVVTNWHVVRDGNGQVTVIFPDGFHSGATVVKADRDWDLAALVIWRPHVAPVPLAGSIPRKGEALTIAGYGSGKFRMASGRCTEYVSPGRDLPFEMLELSAGARQGDSGGPILNQRGELAGVLFGAAWGRTTGSHCGRVRNFLASVTNDFNDLPDSRTMIAGRTTPSTATASNQTLCGERPPVAAIAQQTPPSQPWQSMSNLPGQHPRQPPGHPSPSGPSREQSSAQPSSQLVAVAPGQWRAASPSNQQNPSPGREVAIELPGWEDIAGDTWPSRLKTLLAAVGLFAVFFHGMRLLGSGD